MFTYILPTDPEPTALWKGRMVSEMGPGYLDNFLKSPCVLVLLWDLEEGRFHWKPTGRLIRRAAKKGCWPKFTVNFIRLYLSYERSKKREYSYNFEWLDFGCWKHYVIYRWCIYGILSIENYIILLNNFIPINLIKLKNWKIKILFYMGNHKNFWNNKLPLVMAPLNIFHLMKYFTACFCFIYHFIILPQWMNKWHIELVINIQCMTKFITK